MSVLPIFLFGTKVLRDVAKPVKDLDNATLKLVIDMFETMEKANGIGLAATQVGVRKRVVVVNISDVDESMEEGEPEDEDPRPRTSPELPRKLTLINPEVLDEESDPVLWEEGCLSIPEIRGEVNRPEAVRVRFRDINFREQELRANGLLARVIQHEVDHINGILFIDHLGKARRSLMSNGLRKIKKGDVETSYPVVTSEEE